MPLITTALAHLIIVVIIGVVAGIAFNRVGLGWWSRTIGSGSRSDVTSALVGIAGAFIGFHLAVVLGLLPTPLMLYLGAVIGAVIVLWLWRGR
jgi:uncharacterized membrane protein YeaQ/YmgE (transglycosylase-associated protein family)